jgi:NADH-quinone oxidoreductase subunit N
MSKLAIAFLLAGLAFRITAVPFHYYAPDVFSGTSLPMVGLLSTIPKIAGFIGIVRLLGGDLLLTGLAESAMSTLLILAIATMTVGNLMALVQNDWRRLLAYSSVSHSGYLLVGVLASLKQGTPPDAVFLYLTVYIVMTSGMVAGLVSLSQSSSSKMGLDELKGLYYRQPWLAISLTITLLSMIGVPLTAGFWAKFQIFFSAAEANNYWINICAIIMAFHAALAAIYYLGAISKMYEFGETNPSTIPHLKPKLTTSGVTCLACSLVIVAWFFMPL